MIDDIINGIQIIRKYTDDKYIAAEHDVIYFGTYEDTYNQMTEDERTQMEAMHWFEESDSWAYYC